MMKGRMLFGILLTIAMPAWAGEQSDGVQVQVNRQGSLYTFAASFDTTLSQCAAYHYLTDYDAAKLLPGVISSSAVRESDDRVRVDRVTDEQVMFFHVRLRSVMEYTESPFDRITFTQLSGDSKMFRGNWIIEPLPTGSRLIFQGVWEPDTVLPLFIIDHFARHGLVDRFSAIASLAEQRKELETRRCTDDETQTMTAQDTSRMPAPVRTN